MLGLISPKKEYYYIGKWVSMADLSKHSYFRFKISSDDNTEGTHDDDFDNMGGVYGTAVWVTKSTLPFMPDDIVYFRGSKFHITNVDGTRKIDGESAFAYFKTNGNVPITLYVRKAGA